MTRTESPPLLICILVVFWATMTSTVFVGAADNFVFKPPNQQSSSIFFAESFLSSTALERFVPSKASKDGVDEDIAKYDGRWEVAPVQASALKGDLSLIMKDKAKHHAIAAKLKKTFKPGSRPLVFQYEVKLQSENSCGGAYVKLLSHDPSGDFTKFNDKTPYTIMFGPDRCGNQEKFHFILRHVHPVTGAIEEKHAKKPTGFSNKHFEVGKTRLYRLVLHPDSSFEMSIDKEVLSKGHLLSDMMPPIIPEELIDDASEEKPEDWDDRERIPDPEAVKPEDWDETAPKQIEDPVAVKPDGWLDDENPTVPDVMAERPADWDDEMDGEWESPLVENPRCKDAPGCGPWSPPLIDNPAYKGVWRPPLIENSAYKGVWKPKKIKNPEYFEEINPFERITPVDAIGLELWTMSESVAFDNFILADDVSVVDQWTEETWAIKTAKEGASAPSGPTVLHQLFDAANERPWLWLVYMIGLLIPICVMTMIFCPVKKDKEGENAAKENGNYDAIHEDAATTSAHRGETKEEEALRKKTDAPLPDVMEELPGCVEAVADDESMPELENVALKTTPVKQKATPSTQKMPEKIVATPPETKAMTNGTTNGTTNGFGEDHDEGVDEDAPGVAAVAGGKSFLNGISDENEILRRSPRLKSKTRSRKE